MEWYVLDWYHSEHVLIEGFLYTVMSIKVP
jgi:hypothetical protein